MDVNDEDELVSEDNQHEFSNESLGDIPRYNITKKPGYGFLLPETLVTDFGTRDFTFHLQNFIMQRLPKGETPSQDVLTATAFPVFKRLTCIFSQLRKFRR